MMRRRKTLGAAAALAALTLTVAGCTTVEAGAGESSETLASMEPITLTFSDFPPQGAGSAIAVEEFLDLIEERTEGKVTFDRYWGSSLLPGGETLPGVTAGVADISSVAPSFFPEELPVTNWLIGTGSMQAHSYPHGFLQSSAAIAELFRTNETLQQEFADNNVRPLFVGSTTEADLLCVDPVETLDQADGKRVRVAGSTWGAEAESLGMVPVFMGGAELYEAIQRGVLDCISVAGGGNFYPAFSLLDVAKNYTPASFSAAPGSSYVINLETWNALPSVVQDIFDEASSILQARYAEAYLTEHINFVNQLDAAGGKFWDPRALNEVLVGQQDDAVDGLLDSAPASVDPEALLDEYRTLLAKWLDILVDDLGLELSSQSAESVREAYLEAPDAVDWAAYREAIRG